MGLDSLVDENTTGTAHSYKQYGYHEYNEILDEWVEEFQERFPEKVRIEFVEVSPALEKNVGKTYFKSEENEEYIFIRIAEKILDSEDWYIRQVLLHCMTNAYMYQIGAEEIDAGHAIKKWVCGRVGCTINAVDMDSDEWKLIAEPFLKEDMRSGEVWI